MAKRHVLHVMKSEWRKTKKTPAQMVTMLIYIEKDRVFKDLRGLYLEECASVERAVDDCRSRRGNRLGSGHLDRVLAGRRGDADVIHLTAGIARSDRLKIDHAAGAVVDEYRISRFRSSLQGRQCRNTAGDGILTCRSAGYDFLDKTDLIFVDKCF